MTERTLSDIAEAWIEMWRYDVDDPRHQEYDWVSDIEYEYCYHEPQLAFDLVLEILSRDIDLQTKAILAAGPLEQVLANHGGSVIDQVESLARRDKTFAHLMGGVWRNAMSDEIWSRVQAVSDYSGWD